METKRLTEQELEQAAKWIQAGELVAFPTDTVYGLGADATNDAAVEKIYQAKGRPRNRPINVLIAQPEDVSTYAKDVPADAIKLAEAFWPGPFTLILKNAEELSSVITAGKNSVGLRIPDNELARRFIAECGVPLATPSANSSGRPSPTLADHVLDDLNGKIAAVIDGGATAYGIESTILDYSDPERPTILRPGSISKEAIEQVLQKTVYEMEDTPSEIEAINEKHYEPKIPVYMVQANWKKALKKVTDANYKVAILANENIVERYQDQVAAAFSLGEEGAIESANRLLFQGLRELESSGATIILAEAYAKNEKTGPFMNRLERAANKKTI